MYQGDAATPPLGVMTMHGTSGGPTSSALYDVSTDAFRRWRAGEASALDDLVRVMSPVLWHVVRATGLERGAAEDVVQNPWLTLVSSAASVKDPQAITRWLCTTARREAWRVSRAGVRTRPVEDEVIDARMPVQTSPEAQAVTNDEQSQLWAALGRLPERCQKLLRIVAFEPRPDYTTVASELDMPVGSIGPTRRRCLDKLRVELGGAW
jgi:RNA polymerase sigma factor (sigma-70 family)